MRSTHPWPSLICEGVRRRGIERVALFFSLGRDSAAACVELERAGVRCELLHLYVVLTPSVKDAIAMHEDQFGRKIHLAPHPLLFRLLHYGLLEHPALAHCVEELEDVPLVSFDEIEDAAREKFGCQWVASGIKACDSPMRCQMIMRQAPRGIDEANRHIYPLAFASTQVCELSLRTAGKKAPGWYEVLGRSLDPTPNILARVREQYPEDWAALLEEFPMAEMYAWRDEFWSRRNEK